MAKKKKKSHWRKSLKNNLLPPKYKLVELYSSLINNLVSIVVDRSESPRDMYTRFCSSFNKTLYNRNNPFLSYLIIEKLNEYSRDDLEQQCYLYLLEIWEWCSHRWSPTRRSSVVFYDFVRRLLPKYLGKYLANQIRTYTLSLIPQEPADCSIELDTTPAINLGWVLLKQKEGPLALLSVKQKYLLYLRHSKQLTIIQISKLIKQHRAKIEIEFSVINKILNGELNASSRNKS